MINAQLLLIKCLMESTIGSPTKAEHPLVSHVLHVKQFPAEELKLLSTSKPAITPADFLAGASGSREV
jgi:hypothetical protein